MLENGLPNPLSRTQEPMASFSYSVLEEKNKDENGVVCLCLTRHASIARKEEILRPDMV